MSKIVKTLGIGTLGLCLTFLLLLPGCDIFNPKNSFRLAIPENDFSYYSSSQHLVSFLEQGGFTVEIIPAKNAIKANRLVAQGKADLTFIMNHSGFIPEELGYEAGKLRTISPMFERLFFLFSKSPLSDSSSSANLLEGKTIGIEVLNGETHSDLSHLLNSGKIHDVNIVQRDQNPDFIHFWGTYYGPRATKLIEDGWKEVSLDSSWIDFITLNDPALHQSVLPAIPGVGGSENLNTFSTQTLLVGNSELGEKAVFDLSAYIYQHKLDLMRYDSMYRSISEIFDVSTLLYPLHKGTDAYFRRDQPSFFERYADILALVFSIAVVIYAGFQAIRSNIHKRKKERIDHYFLEFLDIRSGNVTNAEKIKLMDDLFQLALVQMTTEKLDIADFHIFSRLLQQELSNLRTGGQAGQFQS